jgi:hypothetical protein
MRKLTILVALGLLLGVPTAARADDPRFGQDPGGVSVTVGTPGAPGRATTAGGGGGIACRYVAERLPTTGDISHQGEQGQWYFYTCTGTPDLLFGDLWVQAGRPAVDPAVLARQATRYLALPAPGIRTNPPPTRDQLVGLPTWLWLDRATWNPRSATASVPGVSATVTAVPVAVTWVLGDGGRVTCRGPGTAYDRTRPETVQRPSCSYTYRRGSAGEPGGRFAVTATTTWRITWTAQGAPGAGTLPPLTRTSQTSLGVAEVQALNT